MIVRHVVRYRAHIFDGSSDQFGVDDFNASDCSCWGHRGSHLNSSSSADFGFNTVKLKQDSRKRLKGTRKNGCYIDLLKLHRLSSKHSSQLVSGVQHELRTAKQHSLNLKALLCVQHVLERPHVVDAYAGRGAIRCKRELYKPQLLILAR